jgi:negative regulator of sigma E activity
MNEFFAISRLSSYLDGDLPPAEMGEVERAIRENPRVREEYERIKAAVEVLRTRGPRFAPGGFHDRVMARVSTEAAPTGFWGRLRGWASSLPMESLAVAAVAALVLIVVGRRDSLPDNPPLGPEPAEEVAAQPSPGPPQVAAAESSRTQSPAPPGPVASVPARPAPPSSTDILDLGARPQAKEKVAERRTDDGMGDGVAAVEPDVRPPIDAAEVAPSDPAALRAPVAYRITARDPDVVRQLLMLADTYGSTVRKADGGSLEPQVLDPGGQVRAVAHVPAENLHLFKRAAEQLGVLVVTSADTSALTGGGTVEVYLDVRYPSAAAQ